MRIIVSYSPVAHDDLLKYQNILFEQSCLFRLKDLKTAKCSILCFHHVSVLLNCPSIQCKYSTFRAWPCWELETSCVGSLGIPSGGSCPSAGACTLGCVAASGAGPRRRHCAYRCWSGSLPEP